MSDLLVPPEVQDAGYENVIPGLDADAGPGGKPNCPVDHRNVRNPCVWIRPGLHREFHTES